jgi:N-acetylglucosamine kinase-like BadF-type ATPase
MTTRGSAGTGVVVGVDGGGTGSRAVVLDAGGEERARAVGRAALVTPGAEVVALEALRELVQSALEAAGGSGPVEALVAGLAGVGREENRRAFQARLEEAGLARRVRVLTDMEVAFHDAFGDGPGILLVGGTGSVAFARTPGGRTLRTGGWGAVAGDEGSGYWLGLQGLRAAFQSADGRSPPTPLLEAAMAHFGAVDPGALMDRLWAAPKAEVAGLAPHVLATAEAGDPAAARMAEEAAEELARHLVPLIRGWRQDGNGGSTLIPVALVGGLVVPGGPLRSRLVPRIRALGGTPREVPPDPARGAARLALASLG